MEIISKLDHFQKTKNNIAFEEHLLAELGKFNYKFFPSPEYKRKVSRREINEMEYLKDAYLIITNSMPLHMEPLNWT